MAQDIRQRLAKVLSWSKATGRITTPGWENPVKWEDNLEHVLSRRPRGRTLAGDKRQTPLERLVASYGIEKLAPVADPHLGAL